MIEASTAPVQRPRLPGATALADRRAAARHHFADGPLVRFLPWPSLAKEVARLAALSAGGIGLLAGRRLGPGSVLLVQLPGRGRGLSRLQHARVVHCTPQGDGTWLAGCILVPALSALETGRLRSRDGWPAEPLPDPPPACKAR